MELDKVYGFSNLFESSDKDQDQLPDPGDITPGTFVTIEHSIFRTGKFSHRWYGELDFDIDYLEQIQENFERGVTQKDIGVNLAHTRSQKAGIGNIGWIQNLFIRPGIIRRGEDGATVEEVKVLESESELEKYQQELETHKNVERVDFLRSETEFNSQGIKLLLDKRYRFTSSEINNDFTTHERIDVDRDDLGDNVEIRDEDDDEGIVVSYGPTLTGYALTNTPFINSLGEVVEFSDNGERRGDDYDAAISEDSGTGVHFMAYHHKEKDNKPKEDLNSNKNRPKNNTEELEREQGSSDIDLGKLFAYRFSVEEAFDFSTPKFKDLEVVEEDSWDGNEAVEEIREVTDAEDEPSQEYRYGFLYYDSDNTDEYGAYKLPIGTSQDGELVVSTAGMEAAANVLEGGMGGVDISEKDKTKAKNLLGKYYEKKDDMTPPWEEDDEDSEDSEKPKDEESREDFSISKNDGDRKMELEEIFKQLKQKSTLADKVDFLEDLDFESLDDASQKVVQDLYEEKKKAYDQAQTAIQKKQKLEKQKEDLEEQVQDYETKLQEAKEGRWQTRVENFAKDLRNRGIHEPVVKECKQKFSELTEESRKVMVLSEDAESGKEKQDIIELMSDILSQLPDNARLDESDNFEANKDSEVEDDEREVSPEEKGDDDSDVQGDEKYSEEFQDALEKYKDQNNGQEPPTFVMENEALKEDGTIDHDKLENQ